MICERFEAPAAPGIGDWTNGGHLKFVGEAIFGTKLEYELAEKVRRAYVLSLVSTCRS